MAGTPSDILNAMHEQPSAAAEAGRGGVVVIDPRGELAAAVCDAMGRRSHEVRAVADSLMALGDLASRGPAEAVIVGHEGLGIDALDRARTTKALRRLAPNARLIIVGSPEHPDEAPRDFNVRIDTQPDAPRFAAAVRDALHGDRPDAPPSATSHDRDETGPGEDVPETPHLGAVYGELGIDEFDDSQSIAANADADVHHDSGVQDTADADDDLPPPSPDLSSAASRPIEPCGDSDLLDVLLSGGELREQALAVLRKHCDLPGVELADDAAQAPDDHAQAPVAWGDDTFGVLHAPPPADADALAAWAGWLARWYALQRRQARLWHLAMHDDLTGAWNRRYFSRFLHHILQRAAGERFFVTVLVFDIDDFKSYNDRFGHDAGDAILRETVKLLDALVREHDVVARIGGDEFGVIFWDQTQPRQPHSRHPSDVRAIAARFQRALREHRFPKLGREAPGTLTISGGLAGFPWEGRTPDELVRRADQMAMRSKREGKNAIMMGPGALTETDAQIEVPAEGDQT